jgi:hypothetical protein
MVELLRQQWRELFCVADVLADSAPLDGYDVGPGVCGGEPPSFQCRRVRPTAPTPTEVSAPGGRGPGGRVAPVTVRMAGRERQPN